MQHLKTIIDILHRNPPLGALEENFSLKLLSRVSHKSHREGLFQIRRSPFTGLNWSKL